jgi:hypothetical protein
MGLQSKYIILDTACQEPIVFSPLLNHNFIAGEKPVLSAGFCAYDKTLNEWHVWGKSVTLEKHSHPEDAKILNKYLSYDC